MEEIEIVYRKISDLTLLDDNPRKISKRDLERLVDSIRINGIVPYDAGDKISYKYEQRFNAKLVRNKIDELKASLTSNDSVIGDYRITKCYEASLIGLDMPYDIENLHQQRQSVRDEINKLEALIASKI